MSEESRQPGEWRPSAWWWVAFWAAEVIAWILVSALGTTTSVWGLVTFLVVGIVTFMLWAVIRVLRGGEIW